MTCSVSGSTKAKKNDKIHSEYASSWAFTFSIPSKKYISNYIKNQAEIQEYKNTKLNGPNPVAWRLGLHGIYIQSELSELSNKTQIRWK